MTKSIKKNFAFNLMLTGFNAVYPLLVYPYVARVLGPSQLGRVNFYNSLSDLFVFVMLLGLPTYGLRELSKVRDDRKSASVLFTELLVISAVSMVLFFLVYLLLWSILPSVRKDSVLYAMFLLPVASGLFSIDWLFGAFEEYKFIAIRSMLIKVVTLVLVYALVHTQADMHTYGWLMVTGFVLPNLLNFAYYRRHVDIVFQGLDVARHMRPLLAFSGAVVVGSVYSRGDMVLLGSVSTDAQVAFYNVSKRVVSVMLSVSAAFSTVLMSRLAYLRTKSDMSEYAELLRKSFSYTFFLSIPMICTSLLLSKLIIVGFGGVQYTGAVSGFRILVPIILATNIAGIVGSQVLVTCNKEGLVILMTAVAAVVSLAFGFAFAPSLGANGSSIAALSAEISSMIMGIYLARSVFDPRSIIYSNRRKLAAGLIALGLSGILWMVLGDTFASGIASSALFGVLYLAMLTFWRDQELLVITNLVRSRLPIPR